MIPQTVYELIGQNISFLTFCTSIFILIYINYKIGRRLKNARFISATSGLFIYFLSWIIYLISELIETYYVEIFNANLGGIIRLIIFYTGSTIFVFFTELDKIKHLKGEDLKNIKYPLTITMLSILAFGILLSIFTIIPINILNMIAGIVDIFAAFFYFKIYRGLEITNRQKTVPFFITGMLITGLSNSLVTFRYTLSYAFPFIYPSLIIFGAFLMLKAWRDIPLLTDLEWYYRLDRLLVVYQKSSLLLYEYTFKQEDDLTDADLAGTMFGGITKLLKEVLSSNKSINVIDHGDRKVYFSHGRLVTSIVIVEGDSEEFQKRLDSFSSVFESEFQRNLKNFDGNLSVFKPTIGLIIEIFSRN